VLHAKNNCRPSLLSKKGRWSKDIAYRTAGCTFVYITANWTLALSFFLGKDLLYRLAKWDILCRPKDQGGLGILDLQLQNKCLLAKWIVNLLNTDGIWQKLLTNIYLNSKSLSQVKAKPYDSHFWRGLMKIKDEVLQLGSFSVKDGEKTRFWEDTWLVALLSDLDIHQSIT
jgi:hypothetical protein